MLSSCGPTWRGTEVDFPSQDFTPCTFKMYHHISTRQRVSHLFVNAYDFQTHFHLPVLCSGSHFILTKPSSLYGFYGPLRIALFLFYLTTSQLQFPAIKEENILPFTIILYNQRSSIHKFQILSSLPALRWSFTSLILGKLRDCQDIQVDIIPFPGSLHCWVTIQSSGEVHGPKCQRDRFRPQLYAFCKL